MKPRMHLALFALTLVLAGLGEAFAADAPQCSNEKILLPTASQKQVTWRYTYEKPAKEWMQPKFNDSTWKEGKAGFGRIQAATCGTGWKTDKIFLRKQFEYDGTKFNKAFISIFYDEDVNVFLNGKSIFKASGYITNYLHHSVKIDKLLVKGTNTLAVSCIQTRGGQFIDVGLVLDPDPKTLIVKKRGKKPPAADAVVVSLPDVVKYYQLPTDQPNVQTDASWIATILAVRKKITQEKFNELEKLRVQSKDPAMLKASQLPRLLWRLDPMRFDWLLQDLGDEAGELLVGGAVGTAAAQKLLDRLTEQGHAVTAAKKSPEAMLAAYLAACHKRRSARLATVAKQYPHTVYTTRKPYQGGFYAYTERFFTPGSQLRVLSFKRDAKTGEVTTQDRLLLDSPNGMFRDGAVSYDGKRLLFAWRRPPETNDYHLYELTFATGDIRQLTSGKGCVDFEPAYLPGGDILFNSTRCIQGVDCANAIVSNLYRCDKDGKYIRRLGFDQVHTTCPSVLDNGQVVYTRWDYNDRGQIYPQPLFQMNPDGTAQTEYYGNNSWFPTTLAHARSIPGTDKVVAIVHGHHTWQAGYLARVDRTKGTQEAAGVELLAPYIPEPEPIHRDGLGQDKDLFCHPYPVNHDEFLVSMQPRSTMLSGRSPDRKQGIFSLYWVNTQGERELLASQCNASTPEQLAAVVASPVTKVNSCLHALPVIARKEPPVRPSVVDYRKNTGTYYLQDVHVGPGLEGVERGRIKKLRVVALHFRAANVGSTRASGLGGGASQLTPVSTGRGSWDVKKILGETPIYADGSACFTVPARTPLYFQAIDEEGCVAATMRSWSTLQPGETFACVGCHEQKGHISAGSGATSGKMTEAMRHGPQKLNAFLEGAGADGFSYSKLVQPIWDKHCVKCHDGKKKVEKTERAIFSLQAEPYFEDKNSRRNWSTSYLNLTGSKPQPAIIGEPDKQPVVWMSSMSAPDLQPAYSVGAAVSNLYKNAASGKHNNVKLTEREKALVAAWIDLGVPYAGDYPEKNAWAQNDVQHYLTHLRKQEALREVERQNLEELIEKQSGEKFALPPVEPKSFREYLQGDAEEQRNENFDPHSKAKEIEEKAAVLF